MKRRIWLTGLLAVVIASGTLVTAGAAPAEAASASWTTRMTVIKDCDIYEIMGRTDRHWPKPSKVKRNGKWEATHVGWRYNIDADWALVFDGQRSRYEPRWGFMHRSCFNGKYPTQRNYFGLASHGWRDVNDGTRDPGISIIGTRSVIARYATLRDNPGAFVIGSTRNVPGHDDVFKITRRCTSHRPNAWIFGYAPASKRWGWVRSDALRGNPCARK
jgi:hypothetical protein